MMFIKILSLSLSLIKKKKRKWAVGFLEQNRSGITTVWPLCNFLKIGSMG